MEHVCEIMLAVIKATSLPFISLFSLHSINSCFGLSNLLSISNISTENSDEYSLFILNSGLLSKEVNLRGTLINQVGIEKR